MLRLTIAQKVLYLAQWSWVIGSGQLPSVLMTGLFTLKTEYGKLEGAHESAYFRQVK